MRTARSPTGSATRASVGGGGAAGRAQLEVDALEQPAVALDEARGGAAGLTRIGIAGDRFVAGGHRGAVERDDVPPGAHALEMVEPVLVGDDEGAVLQQQADAAHAAPALRRITARTLGDAADHGEAVAEQQRADADRGGGLVAGGPRAAAGQYAVDGFAGRRAHRDRDRVAQLGGGAWRDLGDDEVEPVRVAAADRFRRAARRAGLIA